jgi:hypothetical protein
LTSIPGGKSSFANSIASASRFLPLTEEIGPTFTERCDHRLLVTVVNESVEISGFAGVWSKAKDTALPGLGLLAGCRTPVCPHSSD